MDCCSCGVSAKCCETLRDKPCFMTRAHQTELCLQAGAADLALPGRRPSLRRSLARLLVSDTQKLNGGEVPSHPEVFAEIDTSDIGVVDNIGRRAFGQHMAVADDVSVVANTQRFAHVMVRDKDPDAARF